MTLIKVSVFYSLQLEEINYQSGEGTLKLFTFQERVKLC